MPVGVYRKKTKRGWMHFRDGRIISKKSYDMSKSRSKTRKSTRKGQVRKTARRAYMKNGNKRGNSSMKKAIPHPSVTGMASGLAIAAYLNSGKSKTKTSGPGEGVIKDITDGELGKAFSTLSHNAVNMIGSDEGRKVLIGSSMIALAGAFARSRFPQLKLGGSKLYFRV
jgi:hypothetical protein